MPVTQAMNRLSILALAASDFSYKKGSLIGLNHTLRSHPDNEKEYEFGFPRRLLFDMSQLSFSLEHFNLLPNPVNDVQVVEFDNWRVVNVIENDRNGFGVVILKALRDVEGKYDYMVAFRGTDGLDTVDWFANLDLARDVWARQAPGVRDALQQLNDAGKIHFTGQSLGGGLAQYAAYDFARRLNAQDISPVGRISLTTFNSFGAVRGIMDLEKSAGRDFKPDLMRGVETAHYAIYNDLVHRLGAGEPSDLERAGGARTASWRTPRPRPRRLVTALVRATCSTAGRARISRSAGVARMRCSAGRDPYRSTGRRAASSLCS